MHHSDHRRRRQTDHLLEAPELRRKTKTCRSNVLDNTGQVSCRQHDRLSDSERRLLKCTVHVQNAKQEEEKDE